MQKAIEYIKTYAARLFKNPDREEFRGRPFTGASEELPDESGFKKIIAEFPIRVHFYPKLTTILVTDESRLKSMGNVLMQLDKDGQYKLIEAG